ncbi:unnamed protein product [Trichogramma brassicae]|uniref:Cilia- and flagella-associated protein 36 n=1 Tax=Trichogramma brassicae TaxID=86971 RepID=A0A6H5I2S2_9HYME|nr:unnamed protein product [Trichogramma brassicae]
MGQSAVRAANNNTSQASAGSGGELEKASSTAGAAPDDDAPHRHQQRRRRCSRPEAEDYRHLPSCSHKPPPRVLFSQIMSESGKAESMMMSEPDDEIAWVFDSLIGFLHGPIWSAPLLTFIEDKSLIFEPETQDCQEYREVYQDYKNLVDLLLGCYMEDMEITPEQFERACTMNTSSRIGVQFQQLQLQALRMIEQKYGLTPASLTNEETGKDDDMPIEELLRTDPTPASSEAEKEEMEDVVAPPPDLDIDKAEEAVRQEHERLAAEYRNESALLMEALKNTSDEPSSVESPLLEQETEFNGEQAQEQSLESPDGDGPAATIAAASAAITAAIAPAAAAAASRIPTAEIINVKPAVSTSWSVINFLIIISFTTFRHSLRQKEDVLSKIDLQKRQQYLKAQRDKLVALKKQARSHKLESAADISSHAAGGSSSKMARPSSARVVAEAAIDGNQAELLAQQQQNIIDASVLQVRKALAARLKAEVVQK